MEEDYEDVTAVLVLPVRYGKRLRTTNGVERLNEEIRRRERGIHIFSHRHSVVRLIGNVTKPILLVFVW
jgi:putative transposase